MNNQIQQRNNGQRKGIDPRAIIGAIAALYTVSPIDVMPDFIPLAGQVDDVGVILLAVLIMLAMSAAGVNRNQE